MKLLNQYLAKTVLQSIGLITLVLTGLQFFILFVNQMGFLSRGGSRFSQALMQVLLELPYQVYLFFPIACLIGALVGLGLLANRSELIAMRAASFSIGAIMKAVLIAASVAIFFIILIGEIVVPFCSQLAAGLKLATFTNQPAFAVKEGLWLRPNPENFIFVERVLPANRLQNVYQFQFDEKGMRLAREIQRMVYQNGKWEGFDIAETRFYPEKTETLTIAKQDWDLFINPILFTFYLREPQEMTIFALRKYILAQGKTASSAPYALAFWQRIFIPLNTIVMMLLAIPFIFGSLRSSTLGSKLLIGIMLGFTFYIFSRFMGPLAQVYQFPPFLAAIGPAICFAYLGVYLMRRVR